MGVVLARVDERLIHGQVATAWLKSYLVDVIIVVDDESANDELQTMLLKMAASGTVQTEVCTLKQAVEIINENINRKIFLCAKSPLVYRQLMDQGIKIPNINIGGIYAKEQRKQYYSTVFLTEEEKDIILSLETYDTKVEYRMVPNSNEIDIIKELKRGEV
ncbi:MAG: PTS system mannose/fructose/N-acetylgalactosamine-transporter subunit IIB [Erysipelotrichaceae bacterium]|jgi:mannose/fructose/N-acetylgalactosamine-specific phosphotransferase system component IIB